jgi:hypothetical protein
VSRQHSTHLPLGNHHQTCGPWGTQCMRWRPAGLGRYSLDTTRKACKLLRRGHNCPADTVRRCLRQEVDLHQNDPNRVSLPSCAVCWPSCAQSFARERELTIKDAVDCVAASAPVTAWETAIVWTLSRSLAAIRVAAIALRGPLEPHIIVTSALTCAVSQRCLTITTRECCSFYGQIAPTIVVSKTTNVSVCSWTRREISTSE